MKWALAQLQKYNGKPFTFNGEYDFHEYIKKVDDILDISTVTFEGTGQNVYDDRYIFNIHIKAILTLECAISLEAVEYPLDLNVVETFDVVDDGDDINIITKNTIDLHDVIWQNVYLEKPMRVVKQGL